MSDSVQAHCLGYKLIIKYLLIMQCSIQVATFKVSTTVSVLLIQRLSHREGTMPIQLDTHTLGLCDSKTHIPRALP